MASEPMVYRVVEGVSGVVDDVLVVVGSVELHGEYSYLLWDRAESLPDVYTVTDPPFGASSRGFRRLTGSTH